MSKHKCAKKTGSKRGNQYSSESNDKSKKNKSGRFSSSRKDKKTQQNLFLD